MEATVNPISTAYFYPIVFPSGHFPRIVQRLPDSLPPASGSKMNVVQLLAFLPGLRQDTLCHQAVQYRLGSLLRLIQEAGYFFNARLLSTC